MDKAVIGMNIKTARKQCKMTQKELAEKIGYSESSICKYEQGLVDIPMVIIEKIATVLNVPSSDLLDMESWEKEFNSVKLSKEAKAVEAVNTVFGKDAVQLLHLFTSMNDDGKRKALLYLEDLTEIEKYQK